MNFQLATIVNTTSDLTMSSREIADLTSKRHPDVKRDIVNMFEQLKGDVSNFARTYFDKQSDFMVCANGVHPPTERSDVRMLLP